MRIAHVITRLILGGAQENTVLCCEDLLRQYGDEVLLITGPPLGPEGSLLMRARAGGVPLEIIGALRRPIHPWRDFSSYLQIKEAIKKFRPDVVHTHSAKGGMLGRAAAWSLGVPAVIHTVHGAPFHPWQGRGARWFFQACERWAAKRCHALVSVADAMTDLMVSAGVAPREKCTTIYSGMEVEPFLRSAEHRDRVRRELGYGPDDVVVGKIARLFKLKGHADVIEAASSVIGPEKGDSPHCGVPSAGAAATKGDSPLFPARNARFLFVGDGIFRDRLERQIAAAGLAGHFQFTGLVPPERIPELIAAMDIVVHASLREGLARVLPQALIAGKPVVSYDVDGAREVVIPGETGVLVPPRAGKGDRSNLPERPGGCCAQIGPVPFSGPAGLAAALQTLVADPALRDRMGQEGRRRFTDVFRHEQMTARLRELYLTVLGGRT